MIRKLFFAGSGGQGVLMMGQILSYAAMHQGLEVTFLPSYGPEMRGGTANCTVVISDSPISSPIISEADAVVAMNLPSMLKFESLVKPGGALLINASLIEEKAQRQDIDSVYIPANDLAAEVGSLKCANFVVLGALLRKVDIVAPESIDYAMKKMLTGKKAAFLELNAKALEAFKG